MMSKRSRIVKTSKINNVSGARGGTSNSRGLKYQIDLAVVHTLELISRALCAPHKNWRVRIEPRIVSSDELTAWDLGFDPDDLFVEAKLKPTRLDIEEWFARVAKGGGQSTVGSFHLVYHKGAGQHLEITTKLIRLAREANGNSEVFYSLANAEGVSRDHRFIYLLGEDAPKLLSRLKFEQVPEYVLERNITFLARVLAGEDGGRCLQKFLTDKFYNAAPNRSAFLVSDLIHEARELGVQFQPPPNVETKDLSVVARSSLVMLQTCTAGVPTRVIAEALDSSQDAVNNELEELRVSNLLVFAGGLWSMKPLETPIASNDSPNILNKALSSLLSFINENEADRSLDTHVHNAIELMKACTATHPKLVADAFTKLDKPLKRLGNKRQVWYAANLSIQAANAVPARERDRDLVDSEARALICGTSWAFQRLHKLENARVDAHRSLELARDAGLDRTLAYCLKCLGRLCRMEAERMPEGEGKRTKLSNSVELLREAIEKFASLEEFGRTHPEIGDCYSLLARTFLEMKEISLAQDEMRRAYGLITDELSKDYIDLVILNGDIDAATNNRTGARANYDRALQLSQNRDPEISEMRARAFFKRGANRGTQNQLTAAGQDYDEAGNIWTALEDHESAAEAFWEKLRLTTALSESVLHLLSRERASVRVETLTEHINSLKRTTRASTVARRSEPPMEYWIQRIKEAKIRLVSRNSSP